MIRFVWKVNFKLFCLLLCTVSCNYLHNCPAVSVYLQSGQINSKLYTTNLIMIQLVFEIMKCLATHCEGNPYSIVLLYFIIFHFMFFFFAFVQFRLWQKWYHTVKWCSCRLAFIHYSHLLWLYPELIYICT